MLKYMHSCMIGAFSATMRSAFVKSLQISSAAVWNFFFSYSSREKPLTTRMPRTFSSMDSFSLSYFLNTLRNAGSAYLPISSRPNTSTGTTTTKVIASLPPIRNAMMIENVSISGARTAMRISIMNAICTLLISVVRRVTSDEVENLSMLLNAKVCTFAKISWRTFLAKPAAALALVNPADPPKNSESSVISNSSRPVFTSVFISMPLLILSTSRAVINGIIASMIASPVMNRMVMIVGCLYSRRQRLIV